MSLDSVAKTWSLLPSGPCKPARTPRRSLGRWLAHEADKGRGASERPSGLFVWYVRLPGERTGGREGGKVDLFVWMWVEKFCFDFFIFLKFLNFSFFSFFSYFCFFPFFLFFLFSRGRNSKEKAVSFVLGKRNMSNDSGRSNTVFGT